MNLDHTSFQRKETGSFGNYLSKIILFSSWLLAQLFLLYKYGIVTHLEAEKYIEQANNIINGGTVSSPNFWLYSTQIFIITTAIKLKTGFVSVVLFQILFNGLATVYFYKFIRKVSDPLTSFAITFFLILNFPFQNFNTYLQTESIFFSLTVIFSCYLLQLQKSGIKECSIILLFLILICFTRPTGLLFIPGTFLYLFFRFFKSYSVLLKVILSIVLSIGFLFFLNAALGSGGELDFMLPFRDEIIICGVPTVPHSVDINTAKNSNSLFGIFYYTTHNINQFTRLACLRTIAFFKLSRSYYSLSHNIYLFFYFFPFYVLILFSIKKWFKKDKNLLLYCITFIGMTWLTVILTCDDWHNRFFLSTVPYIYILAVPALQSLINKLKTNA